MLKNKGSVSKYLSLRLEEIEPKYSKVDVFEWNYKQFYSLRISKKNEEK